MTLNERKQIFIERATKLHGNKFDYSQMDFIKQKKAIKIICPNHGKFFQTPEKHVAAKSKGCPKCWSDMRSEIWKRIDRSNMRSKDIVSKEEFLIRSSNKFNNKYSYDLSTFNGYTKNKITIICPIHGEHLNTPVSHMISRTGCPKCGNEQKNKSKTKNYDFIISQLHEKHNHSYEYPEYNRATYKNKRSKIDIICKTHGKFTKTTQKHLSGQACWSCKLEQLIRDGLLVGGYSDELFVEKPELKNEPAYLYYLSINNGQYYKIGISKKPESRYKSIISKAKTFGEILQIKQISLLKSTLYDCFIHEQKLLQKNSEFRIYKKWSTELFNKDIR